MACNCGKNKRLPPVSGQRSVPNGATGPAMHVWFYALPPEESGLEPARFYLLREARWYAQRQKGPGWMIEGRSEPDEVAV